MTEYNYHSNLLFDQTEAYIKDMEEEQAANQCLDWFQDIFYLLAILPSESQEKLELSLSYSGHLKYKQKGKYTRYRVPYIAGPTS